MRYPVTFDCDATGCALLFPDIPEAMTGGETREEALQEAQDALVTAFEFYFEDRREIPAPSSEGDAFVEVPSSVAAKVLLLNAVVRQEISNAELARLMGTRPQEITRVFDLNHATKIDTIQKALSALGVKLTVAATEQIDVYSIHGGADMLPRMLNKGDTVRFIGSPVTKPNEVGVYRATLVQDEHEEASFLVVTGVERVMSETPDMTKVNQLSSSVFSYGVSALPVLCIIT